MKQYQLNTLSWMLNVENKTERGWFIDKTVSLEEVVSYNYTLCC